MSFADIVDIAPVIFGLAEKAVMGREVPKELRIVGTYTIMCEIANLMTGASAGKIKVLSVKLERVRNKILGWQYEEWSPIVSLMFLMGDGNIGYEPKSEGELGKDSEMVNPGQTSFI